MLTSNTSLDENGAVSVAPSTSHDASAITIPDAHFLFHAEFKRTGSDLTLIGEDGHRLTVADYFRHEHLPTLLTPDGAALTGDVVEALAGSRAPGQYAQAGGTPAPSDAQPIGRVATVSGNATAVRNGVAVALNVGDAVYKNDVIQTGTSSAVGVIFGDASTFNLSANARMVLNEFVYNPAPGSANSAFINLVQGSITFIAGEVAHTGDMKVGTPVATMGIRGTAVHVDINVSGTGETKLSVLVEPGGAVGTFNIYSLSGALIGTVNNANGVTIVTPIGPLQAIANELQQTQAELAQSLVYMQQAFQTQAVGQAILAAQPIVPPGPSVPTPPGQGGQPNATGPLTQIQPTDLSSVHVTVNITTTPTEQKVEVQSLPQGTPVIVPLSLTQSIPFQQPVLPQQQTALQITGQPTNPLFEANKQTPGIDASVTALTHTGTFDITALLAAGWQDIGNGNFIKTGTFGTAALSTTSGTVTYVLDNNRDVTQALRPGDVESDSFTIPVTDRTSSSSFTINFTVNGSNDAPVVATTVNQPPHIQTVSETAAAIDGGVTVSDVDSDSLAGATVKITNGAQSGDTLTINGAASGTVVVGGHTIQFSYDSNTHALSLSGTASLADYQAVLRTVSFSNIGDDVAGSTRTITFQVDDGSADDNLSDIATATIVINHSPAGTADAGSVTEDAATTVVIGNVLTNDVDIDTADTHTVTAVAGATDDGTTFTIVGTYGTLVVDKATGAYSYTLANGQANVQALADGQTVTDVFTYTNTDNNGTSGSATLTITVNGANDAPTVDLTPTITEVPIPDLAQHPGTDLAAQDLAGPAISQDGRWVVFFSDQGLPTGGDDFSPAGDVFLYDRLSSVTRVLTDDQHIQNRPAGEHYSGFSVSADGGTAVFRGTQVVDQQNGPSLEINHIYVYDRGTDTTRLLTNPDNGHVYGVNDEPRLAGINLIVFAETDFGDNTQPPTQHLRVTDLAGHIRNDITLAALGISDPNQSDPTLSIQFTQADISGNGRFLTFWTVEHQFNPVGSNPAIGDATLYTFDRTTGQHQVIATSGASDDPWWASMSNDGRFVVFQSDSDALDAQVGGVANQAVDVFLFDRQGNGGSGGIVGITDRSDFQASYASGALGSGRASISPDGRFVIFASDATNLVSGDTNGLGDTFVYNIQTQSFSRVSVGPDGTVQGDDASIFGADISFAGTIAAFGSTAKNFVIPAETNSTSNVFVVDRSAGTAGAVIEDVTTPGTASGSAPANTLSTHGAFRFNDIDLTDAHTVSVTGVLIDASGAPADFVVPAGGFGTLTPSVIDSTNSGHGQIAWDFVVDSAAIQGLNDFQIIRQTYTVQISDGHGGLVTQTVTIRIAGENDAAVISGDTAGTVTEAGGVNNGILNSPTATGTLSDTDVDNTPNTFQAVPSTRLSDHGFGSFTLTAAGVWAYALDNANATVQALNAGAHLTDTFTVRTADGTAQLVTITINGANDAPVLANVGPTGSTTEGIPNLLDTNVSVSDGELNSLNGGQGNYAGASLQIARSTDPGMHQHDIFGFDSAGASFTVVGNTLMSGGQIFATFTHPTGPGSGTGILTINFTSQQTVATTALVNNVIDHITYTNDNDDPPGNPTLVYTFADGSGGTSTGSIAVSLTRVNDAPNLTPDVLTAVSYEENAQPTQLLATGAVSDPDIDVTRVDAARPDHFSGGNFHIQITDGLGAGDQIVLLASSGFTVSSGQLLFGSDTVGAISGLGTANVLVTGFTNIVTPAVASDLARAFGFQSSSENPSSDDRTVTFTFDDGGHNGGGALTDTVTQVVHVTPVNDPADFAGALTGDVADPGSAPVVFAALFASEGSEDLTIATGILTAIDVDNPDGFQEVPSPVPSEHGFGSFTITEDGHWSYTLNTGNADVRALPDGVLLIDTFTVHSIDGTPQQITITIHGANDVASIDDTAASGSVEEDGTLTTGGTLTVSDVDTGESHFQTPDSLDGVYGTFSFNPATGVWGYTLANGQSNVQELAANATVHDTLVVTSFDGTAWQTIDVAINGTDDAPTFNAITREVGEDGPAPLSVDLLVAANATDPDSGATLSALNADTTIETAGHRTLLSGTDYTVVNGVFELTTAGFAVFNSLGGSEHDTFTLNYQISDGTTAVANTLAVTVDGSNAAPVLTLSPTFSITDRFPTQNYGLWSEANDGGSASGGEFQLAHDSPQGNPDTFQIRLTDFDSEVGVPDTLTRTIDLSGLSSAVVTFDYRRDIPHGETDDRFLVLASSDGVNFTQIGNIGATGNGSFVDGDYRTFTFDLTQFISDHTTIRFSVGDDVDDGDVVYVDNITFASAATFTEDGAPVSLGIAAQIGDVDNLDMQSASIVLTNAQDGDDFVIGGAPAGSSGNTGVGGITYTVARAAGSITVALLGAASIADYQAAIDAIQFTNSSDNPSTAVRTFNVTVNDGQDASNTVTTWVNVVAVNDAPVIGGLGTLNYTENQSPRIIDSSVTVSDVDSADFNGGSLTVSFGNTGTSADQLAISSQGSGNGQISVSGHNIFYNPFGASNALIGTWAGGANGADLVVNLNNNADSTAVDALIQRITYANSSDAPSTAQRTVTFALNDGDGGPNPVGTATATINVTAVNDAPVAHNDTIANAAPSGSGWVLNPANGHYYLLVTDPTNIAGATAAAAAAGGYLATITSNAEQSFINEHVLPASFGPGWDAIWLGGRSDDDNGPAAHWFWTSGPEAGTAFTFTNWTPDEPNGFFGTTEYVQIQLPTGTWNDTSDAGQSGNGIFDATLVEWGGLAGQIAFREDTGTSIAASVLLANDTDVDTSHDLLSVVGVSAISAHGGTVALNGNIITYNPLANYNGADSFTYTISDGSGGFSTATVSFNVAAVNDAPVIIASGQFEYWTPATTGDLAIVNHISFADADAGSDDVRVTLRVDGGALSAAIISNDGVTVQGSDTSTVTLTGSTADINAYIAGNHLLFNPPGTSLDNRTLTVTINDLGNNGGPAQSATTDITLHSHPFSTSLSASSTFDLHAISLNVSSVDLDGGNDTLTTSSRHLETATYDGGSNFFGSDSVTLVFTPEQLSQILSSSSLRGELQDYLDGTPGSGSATLDLSNSDWNARVTNFEHASVALATGSQIVDTGVTDLFPAFLGGQNGNGSANVLIAGQSAQTLNGNSGNDFLVANGVGDTLNGGSGNDVLLGGTGNDFLRGGSGNDILFGGRGTDTFAFTEGNFGQDHVLDFQVGEDVITFDQSAFHDFAAVLANAAQDGSSVVITDVSNTVTLHNVNIATLHASNFQLV